MAEGAADTNLSENKAAAAAGLPGEHQGEQHYARDLTAWAWLGLASLAIAGMMAVLLAVSRVPAIESVIPWPSGFFKK